MIVTVTEVINKELITIIEKSNEENKQLIVRKKNKKTRRTLPKISEEFQKTLAETKNSKACKSSVLKKINECTSCIVSLFTYQTKAQHHLYKTDIEVLNSKRNMNSFGDYLKQH